MSKTKCQHITIVQNGVNYIINQRPRLLQGVTLNPYKRWPLDGNDLNHIQSQKSILFYILVYLRICILMIFLVARICDFECVCWQDVVICKIGTLQYLTITYQAMSTTIVLITSSFVLNLVLKARRWKL